MFSCHTTKVQLLGHSNVAYALINHPGVKYRKKCFFLFLFYSFIFVEDEQRLGILIFKTLP